MSESYLIGQRVIFKVRELSLRTESYLLGQIVVVRSKNYLLGQLVIL